MTFDEVREVAAGDRRRALGRLRRAAHGGGVRVSLNRWHAPSAALAADRLLGAAAAGGAAAPRATGASSAALQRRHAAGRRHDDAAGADVPRSARAPPARPMRLLGDGVRPSSARGRTERGGVYDLTSPQQLFALRAGVKRPPASVEKLYTTVALLQRLGPSARLHTAVLGTGHLAPAASGTATCTCAAAATRRSATGLQPHLGAGYGPDRHRARRPALGRGIRRVTGQVFGDASLFDRSRRAVTPSYAPDIPDFGGELRALTYDHGATARRLIARARSPPRELVLTMRGAAHRGASACDPAPRHAAAPAHATLATSPRRRSRCCCG